MTETETETGVTAIGITGGDGGGAKAGTVAS